MRSSASCRACPMSFWHCIHDGHQPEFSYAGARGHPRRPGVPHRNCRQKGAVQVGRLQNAQGGIMHFPYLAESCYSRPSLWPCNLLYHPCPCVAQLRCLECLCLCTSGFVVSFGCRSFEPAVPQGVLQMKASISCICQGPSSQGLTSFVCAGVFGSQRQKQH